MKYVEGKSFVTEIRKHTESKNKEAEESHQIMYSGAGNVHLYTPTWLYFDLLIINTL